jgi:hypothetical protein
VPPKLRQQLDIRFEIPLRPGFHNALADHFSRVLELNNQHVPGGTRLSQKLFDFFQCNRDRSESPHSPSPPLDQAGTYWHFAVAD